MEDAPAPGPGLTLKKATVKAGYARSHNLLSKRVREYLEARLTADGWTQDESGRWQASAPAMEVCA